jgi:hypothetical protein
MVKALRVVESSPHDPAKWNELPAPPGRVPERLNIDAMVKALEAYTGRGHAYVGEQNVIPGAYSTTGSKPDTRFVGPWRLEQVRDQIVPDEHGFADLHYVGPLPDDYEEDVPDNALYVGKHKDGRPEIIPPRSAEVQEMIDNWDSSRTAWRP